MRRLIPPLLAVATLVLVLATGGQAGAEGLSVASYCDVTMDRLQLVKDLLEQEGRSPTPLEQDLLWQQHSTTAEEYLTFGSAHQEEVEWYLLEHPEVQAQIDQLSAEIDTLIQQAGDSP